MSVYENKVTVTVKTVTTTFDGKVTTETTTTVDGDPAALTRSLELLEIAQRLADIGRRK